MLDDPALPRVVDETRIEVDIDGGAEPPHHQDGHGEGEQVDLPPASGPGLRGLRGAGRSCALLAVRFFVFHVRH